MATDFTKNSVSLSGGISPSTTDTPGDIRTRVETEADIMSIPKPYIGMIVYVKDTGKRYEVLTLKDTRLGMTIIKNSAVDTYRELFNTDNFATKEDLAVADEELDVAQADIDALEEADIFKSDKATTAKLGGIELGEMLDGLSLQEVLTKLLYPHVNTEVKVEIICTPNNEVVENGITVNVAKIVAYVTKRSEAIAKVSFFVNGEEVNSLTDIVSEGGVFEHVFDTAIEIESDVADDYFKVVVQDTQNNIVQACGKAFNFVYPFFFGCAEENAVIDNDAIQAMTKMVEIKSDKHYTYTTYNQCMIIAYPKQYGELSKIVDANGFNMLAAFNKQEVKVSCFDESEQDYFVYCSAACTVSQFEMSFKY